MVNSVGFPILTGPVTLSVSVDGNIFSSQGLDDKIAYHPSVVDSHACSIRIKNSYYFNFYPVLAVIIHHQAFSRPFTLVVTTTDADRIDLAPVIFSLGMDFGITINL
jgi:hypothetical protein